MVKCGDLGDIAHGTVSCSFGSTYGSVCEYKCDLGYIPIGVTSITCGRDRSWDDFPPFCQIKRCPALNEPSNGRMFCVSDNTFGSECVFSCNMGYMLRGPASRYAINFFNCLKMTTLEHVLPTNLGLVKKLIVLLSNVKLSTHLLMVTWCAQRNATLVLFVRSTVILVSTWLDPDNVPVVQRVDGQVYHQAVN